MSQGYDLAAVRRNLPLLDEWVYLNTAYMGIVAEPVLASYLERLVAFERGGTTYRPEAIAGYERAREVVSGLINATPQCITINRNASDGINLIAAGFPLREGDEVVMSAEENQAMVPPWLVACERAGAHLRFIPFTANPDSLSESLRTVVNQSTRLVISSHVSCESGTRAPVEIIREIVGPSVSILVDSAQSVGQIPIDVNALGADFVVSNGHKWLCAPRGTGFTWIAPQSLDLVEPLFFDESALATQWRRTLYQAEPPPEIEFKRDASRYEYGTRARHTSAALADAIDYLGALGWDAVTGHIRAMSELAKESLAAIPGVTIVTPPEWEASSGIVVFSLAGWQGADLRFKLRDDYQIETRIVEVPSAVRTCCAYFTSPDDVDRLTRAVSEVAAAA